MKKMNFSFDFIQKNPESREAYLTNRVKDRLCEATLIFQKLDLWEYVENYNDDILNWFLLSSEMLDIEHLQKSKVIYADTDYGLFIAKTSDWDSFIENLMDGLYNTTI